MARDNETWVLVFLVVLFLFWFCGTKERFDDVTSTPPPPQFFNFKNRKCMCIPNKKDMRPNVEKVQLPISNHAIMDPQRQR
jgi:hypothetical protein